MIKISAHELGTQREKIIVHAFNDELIKISAYQVLGPDVDLNNLTPEQLEKLAKWKFPLLKGIGHVARKAGTAIKDTAEYVGKKGKAVGEGLKKVVEGVGDVVKVPLSVGKDVVQAGGQAASNVVTGGADALKSGWDSAAPKEKTDEAPGTGNFAEDKARKRHSEGKYVWNKKFRTQFADEAANKDKPPTEEKTTEELPVVNDPVKENVDKKKVEVVGDGTKKEEKPIEVPSGDGNKKEEKPIEVPSGDGTDNTTNSNANGNNQNQDLKVEKSQPDSKPKGLKDMAFGSQARIDEYTKRNWKMDDTTHPKKKNDISNIQKEGSLGSGKFGPAFAEARRAGQNEFEWNGQKYHTRLAK